MSELYSTYDLKLAAILVTFGFELHSTDLTKNKQGRDVVTFQFNNVPELRTKIDQAWAKELRVEPLEYSYHYGKLKNLALSYRSNQNYTHEQK